MRTQRSDGTELNTYTYVYNGSQLTQMTKGNTVLTFTYDANGTPVSFNCNGTTYYYTTNIQGDVVSILRKTGTGFAVVGTYVYDAWGSCSITGSISLMQLNPLRYRGYVYDQETELYYLQSRYYAPALGRFLNADGLVATGQGFVGNNMFAYCGNNPICRFDPLGTSWWGNFWNGICEWLEGKKKETEDERGTITAGYSASAAGGFYGTAGMGVTVDRKGNIGIIGTVNYGGGMPSVGVNGFVTITNAPSIDKTTGLGTEVGVSVSVGGVNIGGEYVMLIDKENDKTYHGGTYLGGMSPPKFPIPAELHGGASHTWLIASINIYDTALALVNFITPK